jgi:MerR HTH family regulatory protein
VSELLLETVSPMALEVALAVSDELAAHAEEADRLRRTQVERARHAAELARRRYLAVDPDNRLVAASLEADWNHALREHTRAQEDHERHAAQTATLNAEQRAKVLALATDFPALWNDPRTPQRERNRMVRLLLADVTLLRGQAITAHLRFKGGQSHSLTVPAPLAAPDLRRTPPAVIAKIDRLLDDHTDAEVAAALNRAGIVSGTDQPFTAGIVCHIRRSHRLASRKERLQARGMVSVRELAERLGVCTTTIKQWAAEGRLRSEVINDKGERLYQIPQHPPFKKIGRPPNSPVEVQGISRGVVHRIWHPAAGFYRLAPPVVEAAW